MTTDQDDTDRKLSIVDAACRALIASDAIPGDKPSQDDAWSLSSWDTRMLGHAAKYPDQVIGLGRPGIAALIRFAWDRYAQDQLRRSRLPASPVDLVRHWAGMDRG